MTKTTPVRDLAAQLTAMTDQELIAFGRTARAFDSTTNVAALLKDEIEWRKRHRTNDVAQLRQLVREAEQHFTLNHSLVDVRDWLRAANYALAHPTLVSVLFHETNSGHGDDSDGYVEAAFASEDVAEAAKLAAIRRLVANGEDVYWNPDAPKGEQEGPADWTDDFRVVTVAVHEDPQPPDASEYPCPTCHAQAGLTCVDTVKGLHRDTPHPSRVRLANKTEKAVRV